MKILIAAHPFGMTGREPLDRLQQTGWELVINPLERRLKKDEARGLLAGVDGVIAGVENYDADILAAGDCLKVVSRVGIGLDNVDLAYCRDHGIAVAYTPDAPSDGVAEMTVANILNLLRHIHRSDRSVRQRAWNRYMGCLVREATIGVLGVGRIGSRVVRLLQGFQPTILACDTDPAVHSQPLPNVTWCNAEELLARSDVVSLHIPMSAANRHFMNRRRLSLMKTGSLLINTARGPVVDEAALVDALRQRHLGGAALDVYENEPYEGPLTRLDNVVLTAHMAASARQSRFLMELGAAENCIRILNGLPPSDDAIADTFGAQTQASPAPGTAMVTV